MFLILLALACGPKKEPAPTAEPSADAPAATASKPGTALGARMLEHFGYGTTAQQAVIAGDLAGAKKAAATLAALPPVEGPDAAWNADLAVVRERASVIARATSLTEAGMGVAKLGQACGQCHHREERGPKPPVDELGSIFNAPEAPMARHQWATTWMWFGVIGDDSAAYDAGLQVLAEPPTWDPRADGKEFAEYQERVAALAAFAKADRSPENRIEVYGATLGVCASCHKHYRK